MKKTNRHKIINFLTKFLLYIHLLMWVFFLPLTELQMSLFNRRIITATTLGILEIILVFLILLAQSFKIKKSKIIKVLLSTLLLLFALLIINIVVNPTVSLYWRNYYLLYWLMPFVVTIIALQSKINIKSLMYFLLICISVHAVLIIVQHYTNDLLWKFVVDSEGNRLFYVGTGYYNTGNFMDRCPGVCVSGLEAGVLLIFGMILLILLSDINKILRIFLLVLFLIATWNTGTRNVYVQLAFIIAASLLQKLQISKKSKAGLYIATTVLAIILYLVLFNNIGVGVSTKNIATDTLSVGIRMNTWRNVVADINRNGFIKLLFGQGVWQSAGYKYVVDNMYLELIIAFGLIGAIVFISYLICVSRILISDNRTGSILAAFILSALVYGVANVVGGSFMALICLSLVIYSNGDQLSEVNQ